MHNWFIAYNPKNKEACYFYVTGSACDGFLQEDADIIRAFFVKNAYYDLIVSCSDELLDKIHSEGGIIINNHFSKQGGLSEQYIKEVYNRE